jgi:hypothetical protein
LNCLRPGRDEALSIQDGKTLESFRERVGLAVENAIANPAFVHGHLVQSMFLQLIASLDVVKLVKQEDAGEIYSQDEALRVPDIRVLVTENAPSILIEVKNFYQREGREPYPLGENYVNGLEKYASLMRCDLLIAIYWTRWNIWTLVPPTSFSKAGTGRTITLSEALIANRMALLGDKHIATRAPLRIVIRPDKAKPILRKGNELDFTIGAFELYSQEVRIADPVDKEIALGFA